MSESLKLSGPQKGILMKGVVGAYPDPDNLWILLAVRMEVQVSAVARGDAYRNKVFALIQDFEADGRIEEFIRVIVADKPKSPFISPIKKEFAGILWDTSKWRDTDDPKKGNLGKWRSVFIGATAVIGATSVISVVLIVHNNPNHEDPKYDRLKSLLAEGKWEDANKKTTDLLLELANSVTKGTLDTDNIKELSPSFCDDLKTMNRLWAKYSGDKFGFKAQGEIYRRLGGDYSYNKNVFNRFGDEVGWRKDGQWLNSTSFTFNLKDANKGYLPYFGPDTFGWFGGEDGGSSEAALFFGRTLPDCGIK